MANRPVTKLFWAFLLAGLLTGLGWAYRHHATAPVRARITSVSSLKQIGLSFRGGHNDIARFALSGELRSAESTATKVEE